MDQKSKCTLDWKTAEIAKSSKEKNSWILENLLNLSPFEATFLTFISSLSREREDEGGLELWEKNLDSWKKIEKELKLSPFEATFLTKIKGQDKFVKMAWRIM